MGCTRKRCVHTLSFVYGCAMSLRTAIPILHDCEFCAKASGECMCPSPLFPYTSR